MQNKLIIQELVRKLQADGGGNCPHDASCIYGFGLMKCSANTEVLNVKFAAYKAEAMAEAKVSGIPTMFSEGDYTADWPCNTCQTIKFVPPEKKR
jgi:hypothetical protein